MDPAVFLFAAVALIAAFVAWGMWRTVLRQRRLIERLLKAHGQVKPYVDWKVRIGEQK